MKEQQAETLGKNCTSEKAKAEDVLVPRKKQWGHSTVSYLFKTFHK